MVTVRNTSLAGKPTMLYLLFGERGDPRLLPVAMVAQGRIVPITLDNPGWRKFDALYFAPGAEVAVYRGGSSAASARVRRGMWSQPDPLYKLPGCHSLHPLAAVTLDSIADDGSPLVELLASSAPLPLPPARPAATEEEQDSARAVGARAARTLAIGRIDRGEMDLVAKSIHTGATPAPTVVGSFMERQRGMTRGVHQLFLLSDSTGTGYSTSFQYIARDSSPEFRRLIDHLDLNGDGIDEIVLEAWRDDGDNSLRILQYGAGKWKEVARSATSWCGDPAPVERSGFALPGNR